MTMIDDSSMLESWALGDWWQTNHTSRSVDEWTRFAIEIRLWNRGCNNIWARCQLIGWHPKGFAVQSHPSVIASISFHFPIPEAKKYKTASRKMMTRKRKKRRRSGEESWDLISFEWSIWPERLSRKRGFNQMKFQQFHRGAGLNQLRQSFKTAPDCCLNCNSNNPKCGPD